MTLPRTSWPLRISVAMCVVTGFAYLMTGQIRLYGPNGPDGSFIGVTWIGWACFACVIAMIALTTKHMMDSAKHDARVRDGLCPRCGYDLRATFDRCPECGRMPAKIISMPDPDPDDRRDQD